MKQCYIFFIIMALILPLTSSVSQLDVISALSPPEELHDSLKKQEKYFKEQLQRWEDEVLNPPRNTYTMHLPYIDKGTAFKNLIDMDAEVVPFWLNFMLKERNNKFSKRAYFPSSWTAIYDVLRGGKWLLRPISNDLYSRRETQERQLHQWLVKTWKDKVHVKRITVFKERRTAFTNSIDEYILAEQALHGVKTWQELRDVGILGIPSVMDRIVKEEADYYDYLLLKIWTMPYEMHPNYPDKPWIPLSEDMLGEVNENPEYWLQWWKENKIKYWWLFPQDINSF